MLASAPRVLNGQYEHFSIGYALLLMTQQEMDASVEEKRIECRTRVYQHTSLSCLHEVRRSQMRNAHMPCVARRVKHARRVMRASSSAQAATRCEHLPIGDVLLLMTHMRGRSLIGPSFATPCEATTRLKHGRRFDRYDPARSSRKSSSTILRSHT